MFIDEDFTAFLVLVIMIIKSLHELQLTKVSSDSQIPPTEQHTSATIYWRRTLNKLRKGKFMEHIHRKLLYDIPDAENIL